MRSQDADMQQLEGMTQVISSVLWGSKYQSQLKLSARSRKSQALNAPPGQLLREAHGRVIGFSVRAAWVLP